MKYFKNNLQIWKVKNLGNPYNELYNANIGSQVQTLTNIGSYFFFLNTVSTRVKLKKNKLRSHLMNSNLSDSSQFIKILKKNGMLVRYHLEVIKMLRLHRNFFETVNPYLNANSSTYYAFHLFAKNNWHFFNFNFLLHFITIAVDPFLQVKVITLPKFLQKRFKKRYDFQIKHVSTLTRTRYVYKRITLNSAYVNAKKLYQRVYLCLVRIFLNPRNNLLHTEKIFFYRYALRMYKLGMLNIKSL